MQLKWLPLLVILVAVPALAQQQNTVDPRLVIDALQATLRLREAQVQLLSDERDQALKELQYWRAYAGKSEDPAK